MHVDRVPIFVCVIISARAIHVITPLVGVAGCKMDVVQLDDPWCQLVSTTAGERDEEEVVPVIGDKFSIGRKGGKEL